MVFSSIFVVTDSLRLRRFPIAIGHVDAVADAGHRGDQPWFAGSAHEDRRCRCRRR
jgi:hypothetical protein